MSDEYAGQQGPQDGSATGGGGWTSDPAVPGLARFKVRQRLTLMVNRYEIHHVDAQGEEAGLLAFAEQKRMAFKEQVTFFTDPSKTQPVFGFRARRVMDLNAVYDVTDAQGQPIGWFKKDFGKSLISSTWHIGTPDGFQGIGTERNKTVAVLRRVWDLIPYLGDIWVPGRSTSTSSAPTGPSFSAAPASRRCATSTTSRCPASGVGGSTGGWQRRWPWRWTRCRAAEPRTR